MRLINANDIRYTRLLARRGLDMELVSKAAIDNMPTIDAEPVRHGRWILKAHDEGINYRWNVTAYCSECCDEESEIWAGFFPGVPDFMARDIALDSAKTVKLSNCCPNCGAKMDGGAEE